MKKDKNSIIKDDFRIRAISYKENIIKAGYDFNGANNIIRIEEVVTRIIKSTGVLFYADEDRYGRKIFQCKYRSIYDVIKPYVDYDRASYQNSGLLKSALAVSIAKSFPIHHFNPYADLFMNTVNKLLVGKTDLELPAACSGYSVIEYNKKLMEMIGILNGFIEKIRNEVASEAFQKILKDHKRLVSQNHKSLMDHIDELFRQCARLLVIRVDLSYAKDDGPLTESQIKERLKEVMADRKHFVDNMRSNKLFKYKVSSVCKLEYGLEKGFHFHMFFFYDGSKVREDINLARMIGEYWKNNITKGRGIYFNCNAKKGEYKYQGIGMINYYDLELLENLKMAASYITKTDYYARIAAKEEKKRTFFKQVVKVKGHQGRQRKRLNHEQSVAILTQ